MKKGIVLVHGSWHGAWCWGKIEEYLNELGFITVAIDLPGHGINAKIPKNNEEVSYLAEIEINKYADAVIKGAERAIAMGADEVVALGHSMGGVPITFAACKEPDKFNGLIYLAAVAPVLDKPSGAFMALEDQANNGKLPNVLVADPEKIGALRIDPQSNDTEYIGKFKEALAEDVDDEILKTGMYLLTPDAPAAMHGEIAKFPDEFGKIKKTYIMCKKDKTVLNSTSKAIVEDMNAAWKENETKIVEIDASHEVMFSMPKELAECISKIV